MFRFALVRGHAYVNQAGAELSGVDEGFNSRLGITGTDSGQYRRVPQYDDIPD